MCASFACSTYVVVHGGFCLLAFVDFSHIFEDVVCHVECWFVNGCSFVFSCLSIHFLNRLLGSCFMAVGSSVVPQLH